MGGKNKSLKSSIKWAEINISMGDLQETADLLNSQAKSEDSNTEQLPDQAIHGLLTSSWQQ